MNIQEFKEAATYLMKATNQGHRMTGFVWGHAGVGKTSALKQLAGELKYKFFPFYLGTQSDTGDILGLAEFVRDKQGRAVATEFAMPLWLKETIEYCENNPDSGAIIFLDEFNRARRDILQGMFSFALDGKFHTIQIPQNCHIFAAGNPPTDEYFVTDTDETALMGRFVHIKLEPTVAEWTEYAASTKVNSNVIEFIRNQPQLLQDKRKDFKLPIKVDGRAIERWARVMELNPPKTIMDQLAYGIIGAERVVAFEQFLATQDKPLTADEVFAGEKTKILKKWSKEDDVIASLLNLTCENVLNKFKEMNVAKVVLSKKEKKHLMDFFEMIPKDITYSLMDKATRDRQEDGKGNPVWCDFHDNGEYKKRFLDLYAVCKPEVKAVS